MDISRSQTNSDDQLPPETFAADRWVPCLVEEDEECLHLACQAMEPLPVEPATTD